MPLSLAERLILTLPPSRIGLYNPWRDVCRFDAPGNGPRERIARLDQHLQCDAELVLVGEAPGYQGARYSGVPFTSERLLLEGAIPRIPAPASRLSSRKLPFSEQSATLMWKNLYLLGIAERTVLWNAVQMHPHEKADVWSNRTPRPDELRLGEPALEILREAYPRARFIAVGDKAQAALDRIGVSYHAKVRHPANGGATKFAEQLAAALS